MRQIPSISLLLGWVFLLGFGSLPLGAGASTHDHDPAAEFVGVWEALHGENPNR